MYIMKKVLGKMSALINSQNNSKVDTIILYRKLYDREMKQLHTKLKTLGWNGNCLITRETDEDPLPSISELRYLKRKGVGYIVIGDTWHTIDNVLQQLQSKKRMKVTV